MSNQSSKNSITIPREMKSKEVGDFIRKKVIEVIREIVSDPDYGLELNPEFEKGVKKSVRSQKAGKVLNLDKVLKKYA